MENSRNKKFISFKLRQGTVAQVCNPSALRGPGGQITRGQEFETSLTIMVKPHLYYIQKLGWALWLTPVIPTFGRPKQVDHPRSGVWDQPDQHGETPCLLKIQNISLVWWQLPVISATQDAEAGESLEPRRRRLQWARSCHCISAWTRRETVSKKKRKKVSQVSWHTPVVLGTQEA